MRFADPLWLALALPVLVAGIGALRWLRARRASMTYPETSALPAPAGPARAWAALPHFLKVTALFLAAMAMARPQTVQRELRSFTRGIDIIIALDTSTSMRALDFDPTDRITAAKETAKRFIAGRANDRIGVVVFGGAPVLACPLTMDYDAILDYLDAVEAGMTRTDGTAIGDALSSAASHLKTSQAKSKVVILLTDGANNTGVIDPITAAKTAGAYGVKIYAIGTAKRGPALVPVDTPFGRQLQRIPDELDEDQLLQVTAAADGKYFRATNYKELVDIYKEIDRLERSDVIKPAILSYTDLYRWLVLPALLLLLLELSLSRTLLLRIP